MFTGAAQADVTTAAVNVIVMSRTTHYLKYSHPDVHYTYGGISPISGKH
mgnify:CR=1 FL=1